MTNKTEPQPEALRLADELVARVQHTATGIQFDGTLAYSAAELRRLQDENTRQRRSIEALAARRNTLSDRIAQLEANENTYVDQGVHLAKREIDLEVKLHEVEQELFTQTNRAASAEQQLTAMTQRWEMANALNTEARAQLVLANDAAVKGDLARANAGGMELRITELEAQLAQRQVPADGKWKCGNEYLPFHPSASHVNPDYRDGWNDCYRASPTPPQPIKRKPLSDQQIEALRKKTFSTDNPFCPCDSKTMRKAVWAAEAAHGIGTTND